MSNWFSKFFPSHDVSDEIKHPFQLCITKDDYVRMSLVLLFERIFTDTLPFTRGLTEKHLMVLHDTAAYPKTNKGLFALVAKALVSRGDLFLKYFPEFDVLREATYEERNLIIADYEKVGRSPNALAVSFVDYWRAILLNAYAGLEYSTMKHTNSLLGLSEALIIKIEDARKSVALSDASIAKAQGKLVADALRKGNAVLLDSGDMVELPSVDVSTVDASFTFLSKKKAEIIGLPLAYLTGEQTAGLNADGGADSKAIEKGLESIFDSILKPIYEKIFGVETDFQSKDKGQADSALNTLETFDRTSDDFLSKEDKREIIRSMFELGEE
jgi:hypothetical protein